jgi:hypothetical protein
MAAPEASELTSIYKDALDGMPCEPAHRFRCSRHAGYNWSVDMGPASIGAKTARLG